MGGQVIQILELSHHPVLACIHRHKSLQRSPELLLQERNGMKSARRLVVLPLKRNIHFASAFNPIRQLPQIFQPCLCLSRMLEPDQLQVPVFRLG